MTKIAFPIAAVLLGIFLFAGNFGQLVGGKQPGFSMLLHSFKPKPDLKTAISTMVRGYDDAMEQIFAKFECSNVDTAQIEQNKEAEIGRWAEEEQSKVLNVRQKICQTAFFVENKFRFILSAKATNTAIVRAITSLDVEIRALMVEANKKLLEQISSDDIAKVEQKVEKMLSEPKNAYKKMYKNVRKILAEIKKKGANCREVPPVQIYEFMRTVETMDANQAAASAIAAPGVFDEDDACACPQMNENNIANEATLPLQPPAPKTAKNSRKYVERMERKLMLAMHKFGISINALSIEIDIVEMAGPLLITQQQEKERVEEQQSEEHRRRKRCIDPEVLSDLCNCGGACCC